MKGTISLNEFEADYIVTSHCNIDTMDHFWKMQELDATQYVTLQYLEECFKRGFFFQPLLLRHCNLRAASCLLPIQMSPTVVIYLHGGKELDRNALLSLLQSLGL